MTGPIHTYGPSCLLADDEPDLATWQSSDSAPKVRPQFFYTSSLPIDDPLTALPPPSGGQDSGNERVPPQPFSVKDNIVLEETWLSLLRSGKQKASGGKKSLENSAILPRKGVSVPGQKSGLANRKRATGSRGDTSLAGSEQSHASLVGFSLEEQASQTFRVLSTHESGSVETDNKELGERARPRSTLDNAVKAADGSSPLSYRKRDLSPNNSLRATRRKTNESPQSEDTAIEGIESGSLRGCSPRDGSISGSPFARAPSTRPQSLLGRSVDSIASKDSNQGVQPEASANVSSHVASKPSGLRISAHPDESMEDTLEEYEEPTEDEVAQTKIPVGVSRLHLVELPNLKVQPTNVSFFNFAPFPESKTNICIDETNILEPSA